MSEIFVPTLYGLAGGCAYAALHHGLIALRRPVERTHLLFTLLCLAVASYVIAKSGAYHADSVPALVAMRRWELSFALVLLAILPWFIAEYTGIRPRRLLVGISGVLVLALAANLALPYGLSFAELPNLDYLTLPWGERVVDLRVHRRSAWHNAAWLGLLLALAYGIYACVRQYRHGARRRALTLGLALGLFLLFALFNQVVNFRLVEFTHTAEFGFITLVIVMNQELIRERRQGRARTQAILDNVPAVVYMKDLDGRYLLINRRYEELVRRANASVVGKTDYDLFPAAQAEAFRANDRRVLENRQPWEFEEVVDKDGEPHTHVSVQFPLLHPDGTPYAVCGVSTDVSELRKTEREMHTLRRQVWHADRVERTGALAASLAHELSQPLTAILSNAQAALRFLAQDNADLEEIREILRDIVRDEKRANGVINGLRAMLRRQETPRERIDLGRSVDEVLQLMHSELLERGVEVQHALAVDCTALADKAQIQQVMLNLVMNASEAMVKLPSGQRRLWVSVSRAGESQAQVAVRDCGMGIPKEQLNGVFDGFYTTKAQGLGMGLAMCRSILESHGGTIWVEQNEGAGVTFFFTLPLQASCDAADSLVKA